MEKNRFYFCHRKRTGPVKRMIGTRDKAGTTTPTPQESTVSFQWNNVPAEVNVENLIFISNLLQYHVIPHSCSFYLFHLCIFCI